ncbi:hypothetical protein [Novosphingobium resinovorum]|uniref:hypothetical protein n=1 Tax=Novosphingobium resinovorum TaxID=158500 RepID=UPI003D27117F
MIYKSRLRGSAAALTLATALYTVPALAADDAEGATAASTIVVTATSREQEVKDAPHRSASSPAKTWSACPTAKSPTR